MQSPKCLHVAGRGKRPQHRIVDLRADKGGGLIISSARNQDLAVRQRGGREVMPVRRHCACRRERLQNRIEDLSLCPAMATGNQYLPARQFSRLAFVASGLHMSNAYWSKRAIDAARSTRKRIR